MEVKVVSLRLIPRGDTTANLVVKQSPSDTRAFHDWLGTVMKGNRQLLDRMSVNQASLRVKWRPVGGKRSRTNTFTLTYPNLTSLKDDPKHRVIRGYLKRWGLEK